MVGVGVESPFGNSQAPLVHTKLGESYCLHNSCTMKVKETQGFELVSSNVVLSVSCAKR